MGTRPSEIEQHIHTTRSELGGNLHELESRVKRATNWRYQFQQNPMAMLSAAFGAGLVLDRMMAPRRSHSASGVGVERAKNRSFDTWDHMKSALIGMVASRAKAYLGEAIPGFREQYDRVEADTAQR